MEKCRQGKGVLSQMWTSAWEKNHSYHICEIYSDNLAVYLYKIFILLVFNRECMKRNVTTSFRILSPFECFLRYFQTRIQRHMLFFCIQKTNASVLNIFMLFCLFFGYFMSQGLKNEIFSFSR